MYQIKAVVDKVVEYISQYDDVVTIAQTVLLLVLATKSTNIKKSVRNVNEILTAVNEEINGEKTPEIAPEEEEPVKPSKSMREVEIQACKAIELYYSGKAEKDMTEEELDLFELAKKIMED